MPNLDGFEALDQWMAGAAERPPLMVEAAVYGKISGTSSDFGWLASSPGFNPERQGLNHLIDFGPLQFGGTASAYRTLPDSESGLAIACRPTATADAHGRPVHIDRVILRQQPRGAIPLHPSMQAFLLLERTHEILTQLDHVLEQLNPNRSVELAQLKQSPIQINEAKLRQWLHSGLAELQQTFGAGAAFSRLASMYRHLRNRTSTQHLYALTKLRRPLGHRALACLLLPLPGQLARDTSMLGWTFIRNEAKKCKHYEGNWRVIMDADAPADWRPPSPVDTPDVSDPARLVRVPRLVKPARTRLFDTTKQPRETFSAPGPALDQLFAWWQSHPYPLEPAPETQPGAEQFLDALANAIITSQSQVSLPASAASIFQQLPEKAWQRWLHILVAHHGCPATVLHTYGNSRLCLGDEVPVQPSTSTPGPFAGVDTLLKFAASEKVWLDEKELNPPKLTSNAHQRLRPLIEASIARIRNSVQAVDHPWPVQTSPSGPHTHHTKQQISYQQTREKQALRLARALLDTELTSPAQPPEPPTSTSW